MKIDVNIIEQLPGDIRRIAEVIGVEAALKIAKAFRGTRLYIHTTDEFLREIRDKKIREEYSNRSKVRELAIRYELTERQIWNVLGTEKENETHPSLLTFLK